MLHRTKLNKPLTTFLFVFLVAAAYGWKRFWPASPPNAPSPVSQTSHVSDDLKVSLIRVIDGDTIKVRYKGRAESVRLLRINTPERDHNGYTEATIALKQIVHRGYLILEFEKEKEARDRHGRLLAYVMADGTNANLEMVRQGWSRYWTKYGKGKFEQAFEMAQKEAVTAKAGLWTDQGWNRP